MTNIKFEDKNFNILCVAPEIMFEAERQKGNAIVFVDHTITDPDIWYIISCNSEKARTYKLLELKRLEQLKLN